MTTPSSIAHRRILNQHIHLAAAQKPGEVVRWMGMLQAQDYLAALWAVGLRAQNATEIEVEQALAECMFVRTWPARGTLHFVAAEDVRWMLALLGPRAISQRATRFRQLGLDEDAFARSRQVITRALIGGNRLTRAEMYRVLELGRVSPAGQRGIHILGLLAQEGLICFGPRQGKQHTFVLLDEWVPQAKTLPRDEALSELARRFFTSHGPATLQDLLWWSGLPLADARTALDSAQAHLTAETVVGKTYWQSRSTSARDAGLFAGTSAETPAAHLLPAFDEYLVGYTERSAVLDPQYARRTNNGGGILSPTIVIDGLVLGTWKRALKKSGVVITLDWFTSPTQAQDLAVEAATQRYGAFLNLRVIIA